MTQRHSVSRWLGLILSLVGLISHSTAIAQTPLAEARQRADQGDAVALDAAFARPAIYGIQPQDVSAG